MICRSWAIARIAVVQVQPAQHVVDAVPAELPAPGDRAGGIVEALDHRRVGIGLAADAAIARIGGFVREHRHDAHADEPGHVFAVQHLRDDVPEDHAAPEPQCRMWIGVRE